MSRRVIRESVDGKDIATSWILSVMSTTVAPGKTIVRALKIESFLIIESPRMIVDGGDGVS